MKIEIAAIPEETHFQEIVPHMPVPLVSTGLAEDANLTA